MKSVSRLLAACALAATLFVGADRATAAPFTVTDAEFVGNQYTFSYNTFNRQVTNGTQATVAGDPWTSTNNLAYFNIGGYAMWTLTPPGLGVLFNGGTASGTVGWDFSGITGQIAKVELMTSNVMFQIPGAIQTRSFGDVITADVATPATFGTGPDANIYTLTGGSPPPSGTNTNWALGNGEVGDINTRLLMDITSLLNPIWLNNPDLLELRFGFQDNNLAMFTDSAQFFRTLSTSNPLGMQLVVTAQDPSVVPLPAAFPLFAGGLGLLGLLGWRRKRMATAA